MQCKHLDKYKFIKYAALAFFFLLDYAIESILRKGNGFYEIFMERIVEGIYYLF